MKKSAKKYNYLQAAKLADWLIKSQKKPAYIAYIIALRKYKINEFEKQYVVKARQNLKPKQLGIVY